MKMLISSRSLFLLGFAVLLATNVIVLSGVAYNRSGNPDSQITLTGRELRVAKQVNRENTGLKLRLSWRVLHDDIYTGWNTPNWLNREKLEELGFNLEDYENNNGDTIYYKPVPPKEIFIVLEIDGASYRKALERAEAGLKDKEYSLKANPDDKKLKRYYELAKKQVNRERVAESRLFAVDAGLSLTELRERYKDGARFLIVKGLIQLYSTLKKKKKIAGYIKRLIIQEIYVPLKHRQIFDLALARQKSRKDQSGPPLYEVELAYGKRLEPWIVSARMIGGKSD